MGILKAILGFIADLLGSLLPDLAREGKKPKKVKTIGHDKEVQDDINKTIEDYYEDN